jgi:hypothetical protein
MHKRCAEKMSVDRAPSQPVLKGRTAALRTGCGPGPSGGCSLRTAVMSDRIGLALDAGSGGHSPSYSAASPIDLNIDWKRL